MSPVQVHNTLPSLTKSRYLTYTQAEEAVKTNNCKFLVQGREYVAPLAITTKGDLRNGAVGIDEWVELDGGNAYVIKSFKWIRVDESGATQLNIVFDTLLCE
ncbi:MAG: hypothetical protein PHV53_08635 [Fermentimonas sp.]|nr:hypothetical protein [Fermentimonas sp.]